MYERLPNLCGFFVAIYFVYGKFGLVPNNRIGPIYMYHVFHWLVTKKSPPPKKKKKKKKKRVTAPILYFHRFIPILLEERKTNALKKTFMFIQLHVHVYP